MEKILGGDVGPGCVVGAGAAAVTVAVVALTIATGGLFGAVAGLAGAFLVQGTAVATGLAVGGAAATCAYEANR